MEYWKKVRQQAFDEARSLLGLDSGIQIVIGMLGAIVVVLAILFLGSPDTAFDELNIRVLSALFVVLIFPVIFVWKFFGIPPKLHKEQSEEISALEAAAKPSLEFQYHENIEYVTEVMEKIGRTPKRSMCGHITVKNSSDTATAENVSVTLVNLKPCENGQQKQVGKKLRLHESNTAVTNIDPQMSRDFDLFRIRATSARPHIKLGPFENDLTDVIENGKYIAKLVTSGKDIPPTIRKYLVHFENYAVTEFTPLKEDS